MTSVPHGMITAVHSSNPLGSGSHTYPSFVVPIGDTGFCTLPRSDGDKHTAELNQSPTAHSRPVAATRTFDTQEAALVDWARHFEGHFRALRRNTSPESQTPEGQIYRVGDISTLANFEATVWWAASRANARDPIDEGDVADPTFEKSRDSDDKDEEYTFRISGEPLGRTPVVVTLVWFPPERSSCPPDLIGDDSEEED